MQVRSAQFEKARGVLPFFLIFHLNISIEHPYDSYQVGPFEENGQNVQIITSVVDLDEHD
jgi:hypothetical protein